MKNEASPLQAGQREAEVSGHQKAPALPRRAVLTVNGTSRLGYITPVTARQQGQW